MGFGMNGVLDARRAPHDKTRRPGFAELAPDYDTPEKLRAHPRLAAFVKWVAKRPPGFHKRSAGGRRKR